MKIYKQCKSYGNEESFKIKTSSTVYFYSTYYGNNQLYTHEVCLPLSVSQFYLVLYDSYGDSWSSGAYVEIRNSNNQLLVRAVMSNSREQQFTFTRTPVNEVCSGPILKAIKKTTTAAAEESFVIKYGSSTAYTSPTFTNNNETILDICLPSSSNYQYTLVMKDSGNNTWSNGAWIELRNSYDTVVLKAIMTKEIEETIPFSLYTGLVKGSTWLFSTVYAKNWFSSSSSGSWTSTVFNSSVETNGTVYYRSSFYGLSNRITEILFRYRYGIVAYLNGLEIYRDNMPWGTITHDTLATGSYNDYDYRGVIQPTWLVYSGSGNLLAVELHYPSETPRERIDFDAVVTLLTGLSTNHNCYVYPHSISTFSLSFTETSNLVDWDTTTFTQASGSLLSRSLTVTFEDVIPTITHIRLWPVSAQPTSFTLDAKMSDDSNWETIFSTSSISYEYQQWNYINPIVTDSKYRQFKLTIPVEDEIRLFEMQFLSCYDIEAFEYPFSNYYFYKNHRVVNVIPTSGSYSYCRVSPSLPPGLSISSSCIISGTPTEVSDSRNYLVYAVGEEGNTLGLINLGVSECSNLVTIRVRGDGYPQDNSWRLHQGRTTSNSIQSCYDFPVTNDYYYFDFCLSEAIYTFQAYDSYGDGWSARSGYTLLLDDEMELDIMEVPSGVSYVTTVFSTVIPFHIGTTDWKVYQGSEAVSSDWNSVIFDDVEWITQKASEIQSSSITTYIRKTFSIPSISDYRVLNVRMKYEGGVAVYFNTHLVARFNLVDNFNANTEALSIHDSTLFSKFHIILSMVDAQTRINVIAFEIHRVAGMSLSSNVVFDASGVYGVEACSTVIDSYSQVISSSLSSGTLDEIMDMNPNTGGQLSNNDTPFIEWTVENLEGSKWNAFNILTGTTVNVFSIDMYGYQFNEKLPLFESTSSSIFTSRTKPQILMAPSLLGFRTYRWEYTIISSSSMVIDSLHMAYCKPTYSYCNRIGEYPAVFDGEISVAHCPYGYKGYSYRDCSNGYLSSIKLDRCTLLPQKVLLEKGEPFQFPIPLEGSDLTFTIVSGTLPAGLTLDETTGIISGTPTESVTSRSVSFLASSEQSRQSFTLEITIQSKITSFKYPKSSNTLLKGSSFSSTPIVVGDQPRFNITSGVLPDGLVLNAESGEISGKPSHTSSSMRVQIEARNGLGSVTVSMKFTVLISIGAIVWIVIGVIIVIALIVLLIVLILSRIKPKLPIVKEGSKPSIVKKGSKPSVEKKNSKVLRKTTPVDK